MVESWLLPLTLAAVTCLVVVVTTWWWWWRRNSTQKAVLKPKPEDVFRFKNKKVCDEVLPFFFKTILSWNLIKQNTESYIKYLQDRKLFVKKQWFSNEEKKLLSKDFDAFDVTILNKLLFLVCPEVKQKDSRLKNTLKDAVEIRNGVSHEPTGDSVSPMILNKIKTVVQSGLTDAGSARGIPQQDIDAKVAEALQMVSDIDRILLTESESTIAAIEGLLVTTGIEEIKHTWSKRTHIVLPFSRDEVDINDVFIETNFLEKKGEKKQQSVSYKSMFDNLCSINSCRNAVVEGDAGAGKTTLLIKIAKSFPRLLLYMKCRDGQIETVSDLIKQNIPKTTKNLDMTAVMDAFRGTPVLIIIDGYDEANDTSRALVAKLLDHFSTNDSAKFLISTRPPAGKRLRKELDNKWLSNQTFVIKQLSFDDQIDLIVKYAKEMGVESEEIKETFIKKKDICPEMCYPVYIVLFCELFRKMPNEVKTMITGISLMELFMKYCEEKIEEKMPPSDPEYYAKKMFHCACDFSLNLLIQSKFCINSDSQQELSENLKGILNSVSSKDVLSSIFSTRSSCFSLQDESYQFFHSSQQEFMSSKSLLRKCCDNSSVVSADDILAQMGLTRGNIADSDLEKFLNMLNFTILTLLKEDNTEQDRLFPPLAQLATRAGAKFPYWADMLGSFPGNERVEGEAAKCNAWFIRSSSVTAAATQWLRRHKPSRLEVNIPPSKDTPVELRGLMEAVAVTGYSGRLVLHLYRSQYSVLPCDEALEPLRNARCQLTGFAGCVSGSAAWDALAAVWDGGSDWLSVILHEPLKHQLTRLRIVKYYSVTVRHCSVDDPALRRPLPDGVVDGGVRLTVLDVPASGGAAVAGLVTCLAPAGGYDRVDLTRCLLSDEELHELTRQLTGAMKGAMADGYRVRWTEASRYSDGRCWQCRSSAHDGGRRCIAIEAEWLDSSDSDDDNDTNDNYVNVFTQ